MNSCFRSLLLVSLLIFSFLELSSQEFYEVEILPPTNEGIMQTINGETIKVLVGNVKLRHKSNIIDCDSKIKEVIVNDIVEKLV